MLKQKIFFLIFELFNYVLGFNILKDFFSQKFRMPDLLIADAKFCLQRTSHTADDVFSMIFLLCIIVP
jgi:hypothetical protein